MIQRGRTTQNLFRVNAPSKNFPNNLPQTRQNSPRLLQLSFKLIYWNFRWNILRCFLHRTSANFTPVLRTSFFNLISSKILDLEIHTSRTETLLFSFQKPLQICPSINRLSKKQLSFALIRAVVVRYLDANGFFVAVNTTILQSAFRKTNSCSFRFCSSSVPSSFVMSSLFVYDESLHALNIILTQDKRIPQNNPNSSK